jgi:hypothetical protein
MPRVAIANPRAWGSKRISRSKANSLVKRGKAIWLPDGKIRITDAARLQFASMTTNFHIAEEQCEAEREFRRNRAGILYWNGARAQYKNGVDLAMFPPGCNVLYPKVGTARAARRYCSGDQ